MELENITAVVKSGLFNKKPQHKKVPLPGMFDHVRWHFIDDLYASGFQALYMQTTLIGSNGDTWLLPFLDVEDPDHHSNISANIRVAQNFHTYLSENGLTSEVQFFASGTAFRVCLPFLVPPKYANSVITWTKLTPSLDSSTFDRGKFMRVGGYRGPIQDTKRLRVHIQRLSRAEDIHQLTPDKYHRLIRGPANLNTLLSDLSLILPQSTNGMPEGFKEILRPIQAKAKWKKCLVDFAPRPTTFGSNGGVALSAAKIHLEKQGITTTFTNNIYRLSKCPSCNRTGAYITKAGRLKCWHESCSAGVRNDQGKITGLSPWEWIPDYNEIPPANNASREEAPDPEIALATAREKLQTALRSGDDSIILCSAGSGKTYGGYQYGIEIAEYKSKRLVICHATIDAVRENYNNAIEMAAAAGRSTDIRMLSGRTSGNAITGGQPNCPKIDAVTRCAKRGFSPTHVVCLHECELFQDGLCDYFNQFKILKEPGLTICTHGMFAAHGLEADEVIFDEDPIDSLIIEESLEIHLLKTLGFGEQILQLLIDAVIDAAKQMAKFSKENNRKGLAAYSKPMPGVAEAPLLQEILNLLDDLLNELKSRTASLLPYHDSETGKQETQSAWQRRLFDTGVNLHAARWLLSVLSMNDDDSRSIGWSAIYTGAETNKDGIPVNFQLLYSWKIEVPSEIRIVVLDATAFPPALDALFNRKLPVYDAQIPMSDCRWIQVQKPFGLMKAKSASDEKINRLLETAEKQLLDRDEKILIVTHLAIEDRVKEIAAKVFADRDEVAVIHFGISRGTNKFEDFNAVILFGNFTLSPFAASRKTVTLLNDEKQSAEYIHFMNQAEDFQAINRIRPIHGNKTIIIVGRRWPDRLPPPDIVINRKSGAPKSLGGVPETGEAAKAAEVRLGGFLNTFRWLNAEAGNFMLVGRDANIGLLEQYKSWWMREIVPYLGSERVPCLKDIKNVLYDRVLGLTPHRASTLSNKGEAGKNPQIDPQIALSILTFTSKSWFSRILEKIQTKHPDLPELLYQHPRGGRPLKGIGTVAGVRRFYDTIGQLDQFEPERWKEVKGQ